MYNQEGKYKYKENVDFDLIDKRVNILRSALLDLVSNEKAVLYMGNTSTDIGGIQGASLELVLTEDDIDKNVFGESCIKVNVSLYFDKENHLKVASIRCFTEGNIEEIFSLGTSLSITGDKMGVEYDDVYNWMSYPQDIDTYKIGKSSIEIIDASKMCNGLI